VGSVIAYSPTLAIIHVSREQRARCNEEEGQEWKEHHQQKFEGWSQVEVPVCFTRHGNKPSPVVFNLDPVQYFVTLNVSCS